MNDDLKPWVAEHIAKMQAEHGDMVPPWVYLTDTHPYSIAWRMGGGEGHIEAWGAWWNRQNFDREARFRYFRHWPPPPRWLKWMADAVWDLNDEDDEPDYDPYFAELERRGFGTYAEYERDLADDRWE